MNASELTPDVILPAALSLVRDKLLPGARPEHRQLLAKLLALLTRAQSELLRPRPALTVAILPPRPGQGRRAWGRELRKRRQRAHITRRQLATLCATSVATIIQLEGGRQLTRRATVMRLQTVPALGQPAREGRAPTLAESGPTGQARQHGKSDESELSCCCWFAPDYDAIRMLEDLIHKLQGSGGHIEQTFLYVDVASAAAYCRVTAVERALRGRSRLPLGELAGEVLTSSQGLPLDLIGLGSGEAREEIRLVKAWLSQGYGRIRLLLLDSSQPLLCAGYRNAASELADQSAVGIFAIQGNFHHLPLYAPLFQSFRRRRVGCMFGQTFAALENELRFVRDSLCCFAAGDLLSSAYLWSARPPILRTTSG